MKATWILKSIVSRVSRFLVSGNGETPPQSKLERNRHLSFTVILAHLSSRNNCSRSPCRGSSSHRKPTHFHPLTCSGIPFLYEEAFQSCSVPPPCRSILVLIFLTLDFPPQTTRIFPVPFQLQSTRKTTLNDGAEGSTGTCSSSSSSTAAFKTLHDQNLMLAPVDPLVCSSFAATSFAPARTTIVRCFRFNDDNNENDTTLFADARRQEQRRRRRRRSSSLS